ncbi:MAG: TniQ family protein [Nocardioidaceae bacterium]
MRSLPLTTVPAHQETWDSYLTRCAATHGTTQAKLADRIGLRQDRCWPAFHGVVLEPALASNVSSELGLTEAQVQAMQLASYQGVALDLTGLLEDPSISQARLVSQRSWVFLAGSHYCPDCLAEDGVWKLQWRLPWITACRQHSMTLVSSCPECSAFPRSGWAHRSSGPACPSAAANGRLCSQPTRGSRQPCPAWLPGAHSCELDQGARFLAGTFEDLVAGRRGMVAGSCHGPYDCLRAWQTAICYAAHFNAVDPGSGTWGGSTRWRSPPRDAALMARLQAAAAPLVLARDARSASRVLNAWIEHAGIGAPAPGTFTDAAPASPALAPVLGELLRRTGRAHSMLIRRMSDLDSQERILHLEWDVGDIPQLSWPCALPAPLLNMRRPGLQLQRAVLSIILARMLGAATWGKAGQALGWRSEQAADWTRYAFSSRHGAQTKPLLLAAALALARILHQQPTASAWSKRPSVRGTTRDVLADAQHGECVRSGSGH